MCCGIRQRQSEYGRAKIAGKVHKSRIPPKNMSIMIWEEIEMGNRKIQNENVASGPEKEMKGGLKEIFICLFSHF